MGNKEVCSQQTQGMQLSSGQDTVVCVPGAQLPLISIESLDVSSHLYLTLGEQGEFLSETS